MNDIALNVLLTSLTAYQLASVLEETGYTGVNIQSVKFVKTTPSGSFMYDVTYLEDGDEESCPIFVSYKNNKLTAEF